ncbi:interferon-induced protein 44-like [Brienomyrus brachyistius]|uniref:interferon-induced protein 44-like n=1 Tax=Brienomyrus brachyistius TaxID=42636 RepID=UPI0020B3D43A|nr:interferon-induced protein 44-like [Brienomyrus brachyistius]
MTFNSRLDTESEKKLLKLFDPNVNFRLLYKGSHFRFDISKLFEICSEQGSFILIVYFEKYIFGGFLKKSLPHSNKQVEDEDAFVFSLRDMDSTATRFSVNKGYHAFHRNNYSISFGNCLKVAASKGEFHVDLCSTCDFNCPKWSRKKQLCDEVELHRVQAGDLLPGPWRGLPWTEANRDELRKNLVSYEPPIAELTQVRVLLLGPAGAGKSSFIGSIKSALYGHIVNLPGIGSKPDGCIKKLKSYPIRAEKGGQPIALTLCDVWDLGDTEETGLSLHDALAVIKGHAPEGYKFQSGMPINLSSASCCLDPELQDKIHCVVFVLNARDLHSYGESLVKMIKKLRREISDLDVPQLVLLSHVDEVCHAVNMDVRYVYTSRIVQKKVQEAASLAGVPVSFVLPVKNYMSELTVNRDNDILIFSAVRQILYAIDDTFEV